MLDDVILNHRCSVILLLKGTGPVWKYVPERKQNEAATVIATWSTAAAVISDDVSAINAVR
jgi:hypothetical protein